LMMITEIFAKGELNNNAEFRITVCKASV